MPYTVADTLQSILANQRLEARQKMLDSLNQQKTQAEIGHWAAEDVNNAENIASNKAFRESAAAENSAQHKKIEQDAADKAKLDAQFDTAMQTFDPSHLSPEQQQAFQLLKVAGDREGLKGLLGHIATQPRTDKKPVPQMRFNESNGKLEPVLNLDGTPRMVQPGADETIRWPRAPIGPQPPTPVTNHAFDTPEGAPVFTTNRLDAKGNPVVMTIKDGVWQPYNGPMVKPGGDTKPKIDASIRNKLSTLKGKATPQPRWLGYSQTTPDAKDVAAYYSEQSAATAKYQVSPEVKDLANNLLTDPNNSDYSSSELVELRGAHLSEKDKKDLLYILADFR